MPGEKTFACVDNHKPAIDGIPQSSFKCLYEFGAYSRKRRELVKLQCNEIYCGKKSDYDDIVFSV
jgi:hypothetical protein